MQGKCVLKCISSSISMAYYRTCKLRKSIKKQGLSKRRRLYFLQIKIYYVLILIFGFETTLIALLIWQKISLSGQMFIVLDIPVGNGRP